jgi:hypothetical protein
MILSTEISMQKNRHTIGIFQWHRKVPLCGTETTTEFSIFNGKIQIPATMNLGQKQETLSTPGRL